MNISNINSTNILDNITFSPPRLPETPLHKEEKEFTPESIFLLFVYGLLFLGLVFFLLYEIYLDKRNIFITLETNERKSNKNENSSNENNSTVNKV
jgi:hypothetical protein